jgi:hypothetical protein
VRVLKLVLTNPLLKRQERDTFLRIEATPAGLVFSSNQNEMGVPAVVLDPGVAFVRYRKLLPLVQSFKDRKKLTITIDSTGLRIGDYFNAGSDMWWAIYDNPESAPRSVEELYKSAQEDLDEAQLTFDFDEPMQLVWRNNLNP